MLASMKRRSMLAGLLALGVSSFLAAAARPQTSGSPIRHPPGAYAAVNGIKLWYESEGRGEPLVLVPGGPGDPHTVFHLFFSRLADRQRIVYFDEYGVGKSDRARSKSDYSFARDVENLDGLRKALGLTRMNLLGPVLRRDGGTGVCSEASGIGRAAHPDRLVL